MSQSDKVSRVSNTDLIRKFRFSNGIQSEELEALDDHFHTQGWFLMELPDPKPVHEARARLLEELRHISKDAKITLERYHEIAQDDLVHTRYQEELTGLVRAHRLAHKVITAQLDFFKAFLGPDLNVQTDPYLRITRPGKARDNVGYHRDTHYGHLPTELSVLIPFVDVAQEAALAILSGSHVRAEADFPTTQVKSPDVEKGSVKNQLGFLYAPKIIDEVRTVGMKAIPLKVGEALIFSQATVHGSVVNGSSFCRWSCDIRVVNAWAPLNPALKTGYYEALRRSSVFKVLSAYHQAQALRT